jgi:disulfide bond formation protein DsbB
MLSYTKSVRWTLLVGSAVLALLLAACGGGGDSPTAAPIGDAANGQTLFTGTCSSCHGPDAKGIAGLGKDLTTSTWVAEQTDAQLVEFIKTGRPATDPLNTTGVDMPPRGGNPALTDSDIEDIVAYVRSIHE